MKLTYAVVLSIAGQLCMATAAFGDDPPASIDLSKGWVFSIGDQPTWSDASLDDADWQPIRLGAPWEEQGHTDYDGFAWYRLRIRIPGRLRDDPRVRQLKALRMTLGKVDDVDETFVNGQPIGRTGTFPDHYTPAWLSTRVYSVPADLIRWDEENVIAVRVYDGNGLGGLYEGPYRLEVAEWGDFLVAEFDRGRNRGVFDDQDGLPIAAILRNKTDTAVSGTVTWTVQDDEDKQISVTSVKATLPASDSRHVACGFAPNAPGFYHIECAFQATDLSKGARWSTVMGYRPEQLQVGLTKENDFDDFWNQTLQSLAAVKPQFQLARRPSRDSETHEVYEVEMRSLGDVRVRGWYEKPKANGIFPAVLRVPGYGSSMQPTGDSDRIAFFSFNIRGHGNSQDDVPGTPQDYWIRGLDDKQGYYYQGAYADCVRAVDFLVSRPEVDAKRIAVTGGSQGGGLSWATAALDPRISLCAPNIPFLCDWKKYFRATEWPEIDAWIDAAPHRSWESTLRTMSYFDTLNMADRIECPVLLGIGLQDPVCPAATIFSVYNRLRGQKEYRVYADAGHWVGASHQDVRRAWFRKHFDIPRSQFAPRP